MIVTASCTEATSAKGPTSRAAAHSAQLTSTMPDHATATGPKRNAAHSTTATPANTTGSSARVNATATPAVAITSSAASISRPRTYDAGARHASGTIPLDTS